MKKLTITPRVQMFEIEMLEQLVENQFSESFKSVLQEYAGCGIYESYFIDESNNEWEISQFNLFKDLYGLTKEFKDKGWGLKIPPASASVPLVTVKARKEKKEKKEKNKI